MQNKSRSSNARGAARRPAASRNAARRPSANRPAGRRPHPARRRKNGVAVAVIAGALVLIIIAAILILRPKPKATPPEAQEVVEAIPMPDPVEDLSPEEDDGVPPGSSTSDTEGDLAP